MACRYFPMYDLGKAVGPNRPNLPDDVTLLQTLFKTHQAGGDPLMEGIPPVAVTGLYSASFGQAIRTYQTNANKRGAKVWVDGVVDPLPSKSGNVGDWDSNYSTGAQSTMLLLCYRLWRRNRAVYIKVGDTLKLPFKPDPFTDS